MAKTNNGNSKRSIRPEMFVAVFAIVISMLTLFVYVYQSNIMKQQQKISVWPYLSFGPSWGDDYLIISLTNKGIGPAIIQSYSFEVEGDEVDEVHKIMTLLPDSIMTTYSYSSIWNGQVLMAGETMNLLTVKDSRAVEFLLNLIISRRVELKICYSSVYGETWTTYGTSVEPGKCKN